MKTGIFLTLSILLSTLLFASMPDSTARQKHTLKSRFIKIYKGEKGVERYEIKRTFNEYMSKQEFQNAVDFLTGKLEEIDSLENDYRMHTVGYVYGFRGYAQYIMEQYEAALSDLNRTIEIVPEWSTGYYIRGLIQYQNRELQAAVDDYTQAIERKHKYKRKVDTKYYMSRGDAYWNLGQTENAAADFTKCIKLDSRWAYAYLRRGSARYALEDQQGAKADYEKAIKIDPHFSTGYQVLGMFYYSQKDYDAAIGVIKDGLENNPDDPFLYEEAGSFYLETGDNPAAISYFTKCLELCSDDSKTMPRLMALVGNSVAYYNLGDKENSKKYFNQARQLEPLLNNGKEGLKEFSGYCLGFMEKELETLPLIVEEFKNPE